MLKSPLFFSDSTLKHLKKYTTAMQKPAQIPSMTSPLALAFSVFLSVLLSLITTNAHAQSLPEIQRLITQKHLPQALEQTNAYLVQNPKEAQAYFLKGLILSDLGRVTDAQTQYIYLTENFPELAEPYNNLAVIYAAQKEYRKALNALEMAIRTQPNYALAHENLGDIYTQLAQQAYDKALALNTDSKALKEKSSKSLLKK